MPLAETFERNADRDADREPTFGRVRRLSGGCRHCHACMLRGAAGKSSRKSRPVISMLPSSVNKRRRSLCSATHSKRVRCR